MSLSDLAASKTTPHRARMHGRERRAATRSLVPAGSVLARADMLIETPHAAGKRKTWTEKKTKTSGRGPKRSVVPAKTLFLLAAPPRRRMRPIGPAEFFCFCVAQVCDCARLLVERRVARYGLRACEVRGKRSFHLRRHKNGPVLVSFCVCTK